MSNLVLYSMEESPPCRAVIMTAEVLGIPLTVKELNLMAGEQLTPEFLKKNPAHTVPTLDDNGFSIGDSHAIMTYLVNKYGKDDTLYPKDAQKRATVDEFLHIDNGTLFATAKGVMKPIVRGHVKAAAFIQENAGNITDVYKMMNTILEGKEWLTGSTHFTLADISCMTSMLSLNNLYPMQGFPNIAAWLKRCETQMPKYDKLIAVGHKKHLELLKSKFE